MSCYTSIILLLNTEILMNRIFSSILKPFELLMELKWFFNRTKIEKIKLVVFDVDGVLTKGYLLVNSDGEISREFNVRDGIGIKKLQNINIIIAFISGGEGKSTLLRAKSLGVNHCLTNIMNKREALIELQKELDIAPLNTVFIGDDMNDIDVKESVSLLIGPRDASFEFASYADLLLKSNGGMGVAREISQRILDYKN